MDKHLSQSLRNSNSFIEKKQQLLNLLQKYHINFPDISFTVDIILLTP